MYQTANESSDIYKSWKTCVLKAIAVTPVSGYNFKVHQWIVKPFVQDYFLPEMFRSLYLLPNETYKLYVLFAIWNAYDTLSTTFDSFVVVCILSVIKGMVRKACNIPLELNYNHKNNPYLKSKFKFITFFLLLHKSCPHEV